MILKTIVPLIDELNHLTSFTLTMVMVMMAVIQMVNTIQNCNPVLPVHLMYSPVLITLLMNLLRISQLFTSLPPGHTHKVDGC